ncbi:MAG: hypothetical protein AAFY71_03785 [Bacteroidota bacterium]
MRKALLLLLGGCLSLAGIAQQRIPINVSYYAPYLIQPGLKVSTDIYLTEMGQAEETSKLLFVSPQVGYFSQPNTSRNLLFQADMGIRFKKAERARYISPSVGLAYVRSTQILSNEVNLGSLESTPQTKIKSFFLPTLNLKMGREGTGRLGQYVNLFLGHQFSTEATNASFFGLELGLSFYL